MRPFRAATLAGIGGGFATLLLVAVITATLVTRRSDSGPLVFRVERRDFARKVVAEGVLRPVQATPINVPVEIVDDVKIAWLAVDGSRVRADDQVARLDPSQFEQRRDSGAADREIARHKIDKATAQREATQANLQRDAEIARRERETAQQFQSVDEEIFSRHERVESAIDTELAQARERHAKAIEGARGELQQRELDLLLLERRQAELEIENSEEVLRAIGLTAPHDGTLLLERGWRGDPITVGELVCCGQKLAEIPVAGDLEAEVFVLEADAGGLAIDQAATLVVEGAGDRSFAARISRVDKVARPRLRRSPVQYFGVTLKLAEQDPGAMKPGQRVQATLVLEEREQALVVPRQAVFSLAGKRVVYRQSGGDFEAVDVEVGSSGLGWLTLKGDPLAVGDRVALRDPRRNLEEVARGSSASTSGVAVTPAKAGS